MYAAAIKITTTTKAILSPSVGRSSYWIGIYRFLGTWRFRSLICRCGASHMHALSSSLQVAQYDSLTMTLWLCPSLKYGLQLKFMLHGSNAAPFCSSRLTTLLSQTHVLQPIALFQNSPVGVRFPILHEHMTLVLDLAAPDNYTSRVYSHTVESSRNRVFQRQGIASLFVDRVYSPRPETNSRGTNSVR